MNRHDSLTQHFRSTVAEHELLSVARRGVVSNPQADEPDFSHVIDTLKDHRCEILFPWFWSHEDVNCFFQVHRDDLSPDDIAWYLRQLHERTSGRETLHWIERVNLFHAFGLSRLVVRGDAQKIIEDLFGYSLRTGNIRTLCDLSAHNVLAMLHEYDDNGMITFLESIAGDPRILQNFADYQLYYYGGVDTLVTKFRDYLKNEKRVMVPHTVAALLSYKHVLFGADEPRIEEVLRDELLHQLPPKLQHMVDRLAVGRE